MAEKRCVNCMRSNDEKATYCIQCGAPLGNKCQSIGSPFGEPCRKSCGPEAAYCPACGCETLFKRNGMLAGQFNRQYEEPGDMDELLLFSHPFFSQP